MKEDNIETNLSSNTSMMTQNPEENNLDETIKCLFLRARKPRSTAIDNSKKIITTNIHSEQAKYVLRRTKETLGDFQRTIPKTMRAA